MFSTIHNLSWAFWCFSDKTCTILTYSLLRKYSDSTLLHENITIAEYLYLIPVTSSAAVSLELYVTTNRLRLQTKSPKVEGKRLRVHNLTPPRSNISKEPTSPRDLEKSVSGDLFPVIQAGISLVIGWRTRFGKIL